MNTKVQIGLIAVLALSAAALYGSRYWTEVEAGPEATSTAAAAAAPTLATVPTRSLSAGLPEGGHWRGQPVLADLNGDGHLDLVAALRRLERGVIGDGLHVWLGDGQGGWTPANEGLDRHMGYGGASVADIDGDGDLDLAYSSHDTYPRVFSNDGGGAWTDTSLGIVTEGPCQDVALGDLDGDGAVELATIGFFTPEAGLCVFERDPGSGLWNLVAELLTTETYGSHVLFDDLDGDGKREVLATSDIGVKVWRFDDGEFTSWSDGLPVPEVGGSELALATWDLDGDGIKEIVVAGMVYEGHDPLRAYRWDGSEWTAWGEGFPSYSAFFDVDFAQTDGFGPPEIVAAGKYGVSLIVMPEIGRFEEVGVLEGTHSVFNVAVGDVDGDGSDEIVFVGIGGVSVLDLGGVN